MTSQHVWPGFALIAVAAVTAGGCGGGSASVRYACRTHPRWCISITVTPSSSTVLRGQTQAFAAKVTGTTNSAVTWSVQEPSGGTIDSTGLYTAPQNSIGTFHVVATSQANSASMGIAAVTVEPSQLTISPATVTLAPGGTQTFTVRCRGVGQYRCNLDHSGDRWGDS